LEVNRSILKGNLENLSLDIVSRNSANIARPVKGEQVVGCTLSVCNLHQRLREFNIIFHTKYCRTPWVGVDECGKVDSKLNPDKFYVCFPACVERTMDYRKENGWIGLVGLAWSVVSWMMLPLRLWKLRMVNLLKSNKLL
jgi:hypothetical protein